MAKKSTWKFRYEMSEKRADCLREDAYNHFMRIEALVAENAVLKSDNAALRARLAAMVAAGRVDMAGGV